MTNDIRNEGGAPTPALGFPDGPKIRRIDFADVKAAFSDGLGDFLRAPMFGLFFGGFYAIGGLVMLACLTIWNAPVAIIPLAVAFPLIGPFIAVGLYEVSRRISSGEPLSWKGVLGVIFRQKDRELAWLAFVTLFIFWIWAYQVRLLIALFLGSAPLSSFGALTTAIFATQNGLSFLLIGTLIGSALGLVLYSVTVIAAPLLLDRDIDIVTAMATSVAVVRRYPGPMIAWAVIVGASMMVALAPLFLGLLIVLPVLGHAAWRLFERAIAPQ